ncbi:MAG TPA: cyclic beta 1-2 glucan synthetase, partial [Verrucomicrobiae bacterium]
FPSRYNVDIDRRHRWIRGDWQITQWLLPRVPGSDARRIANPLSVLSQWKIFDNLRRSLVPIALLLFLLGSWLLMPELDGVGLLLVVGIIALPGLLASLDSALRKPPDLPWAMHLRGVAGSVGRQLGQIFLTLAFLSYDAFISLDAISRTLLRLLVTRKRLLEWQTASDSERTTRADLADFYATMWITPGIALATGIFLVIKQPGQLIFALPLLFVWLAAPWIAWWISQPIESATPDLTAGQLTFLRRTARKTWHFFDTFVSAQENWLPPDNFQELPAPTIATRTSPTNMGLALLANLAARDFGYLSLGGLIQRTQDTLATMQRLERHRGHFYNWYETRTLKPLLPLYISSVDSGNLAGHLLTLGSGLREQADEKIFTPQIFAGLRDTVRVLKDLARENNALAELDAELEQAPDKLRAAFALLERATAQATEIAAALANEEKEISGWSRILERDCKSHLHELQFLAPWLALPASASAKLDEKFAQPGQAPTLREVSMLDQSSGQPVEDLAGGAELARCLREAGDHARQRLLALEALAKQSDELAAMDFTFLFNTARDLFSTGFNVTERRFDTGFYDLLASEARLCGYVAIALGQVPQDHWFSMGRLLVASRGEPILISWSGSMFEYLMPMLVMPNYENTLLDHTCRAAVQQQIEYGKLRGVPW